jgi:transcriptional regulator with XRE-family HTH domain
MEAIKGSIKLGSYLKRLRTGYGYSLRKVEEKARQRGGGHRQLPALTLRERRLLSSFDKLRILATIFNVSIQSFSDVVDLESFEALKPLSGEPEALLLQGNEEYRLGSYGQAYAIYERADRAARRHEPYDGIEDARARARLCKSFAPGQAGQALLAEQELRQILKGRGSPRGRARGPCSSSRTSTPSSATCSSPGSRPSAASTAPAPRRTG